MITVRNRVKNVSDCHYSASHTQKLDNRYVNAIVCRYEFWVLPDVFTLHLPHVSDRSVQDYWECVNAVANMVMLKIQYWEGRWNGTSTDRVQRPYTKLHMYDNNS